MFWWAAVMYEVVLNIIAVKAVHRLSWIKAALASGGLWISLYTLIRLLIH